MDNNVVYKSQLAVIMFIMTFTFKVSRLPPLVAESVGSSGSLLVFLYMALETVMFIIVYRFIRLDGMNKLEKSKNAVLYKCLMAVLAVNFACKFMLMYSGVTLFALDLLFDDIATEEVVLTIIVPVVYIAYKGIRVIARTSVIVIWLIALVLIVNFVFIKANPIFSNNLPLLNGSFADLLRDGDDFFFWFGDYTPLLFIKVKNSKRSGIAVSLICSWILVMFSFILMYALYGAGAPHISNFIVRVASFNQFASKLGRLDWTGMIIWLIMALLFLSVYLWAFAEAASKIIKKRSVALAGGSIITVALVLAAKEVSDIATYAMGDVKYLAVAANYGVPIILLIMAAAAIRKRAKNEMPPKEVADVQGA